MDRASVLESLQAAVRGPVVHDPDALVRFSQDASHLSHLPLAAVTPADPEDVVALVRWARTSRVPLTPRGGGTSMDGESVPAPGGVVVDLSGWDSILEIDEVERVARVGPGVVNLTLHRALRPYGLFFPPNPGSWTSSTLGGNAATNASGPRSYRYGPTRSWVRAIDVVLGTGERLEYGRRVQKRSVGPDLLGLFVGSEGTLGIFLELTVRLAPLPDRRTGIVVRLPEPSLVGPVASGLRSAKGLRLSALELLDVRCSDELARLSADRLAPGATTLLLELESTAAAETHDLEQLLVKLRALGVVEDPAVYSDADDMWTLRGRSGEALDRILGSRVREDVAVPLGKLPALLDLVQTLARSHGTEAYVYGHLGEASLHPNFALRPGTPEGERLRMELLLGTVALGGTVSAEHGVGIVKRSAAAAELGGVASALLRSWKNRCDPDGILNPGKLYPGPPGAAPPPERSPGEAGGGRTPAT